MASTRHSHTASVLLSGKILVAGRYYNNESTTWSYLNTSELHGQLTELWTKTGNMTMGLCYHTVTILCNGKAPVTDGYFWIIMAIEWQIIPNCMIHPQGSVQVVAT
ncbi:unnamed protein product [Rotaria magnacalcarata]